MRKILTKNLEGQTSVIYKICVASLSVVESGAGDLLSIVQVRSGKVHNRGHGVSSLTFLNVTYTGCPSQSWRQAGTGSQSRAVQPHGGPFHHLLSGWSYSGSGQGIWGGKC